MIKENIPILITALGQVGFRLTFDQVVVYIDPYLSDSVAQTLGSGFLRQFPVPFAPEMISDADWVLVTHEHLDHCDPKTLVPLSATSPQARFICPTGVRDILRTSGIAEERIILTDEEKWFLLSTGLRIIAVPAAHPEIDRDEYGRAKCVGFILEYRGQRFYHAGDTSVADELLKRLKTLAPIDVAFLPVNERNFFREREGIIGNMSVRESFAMAEEIGVQVFVPTHWDMFKPNCIPQQEIELLYRFLSPMFKLVIYPTIL